MSQQNVAANDRFNKSQREQLAMAAEAGVVNSECLKHPEWGPMLMNMCWNRERKGMSVAPVYFTADWLDRSLPREDGMLYDELMVLHYVLSVYEKDETPRDVTMSDDGTFDRCMFLFLNVSDVLMASGSPLLDSGRVSVNDAGWLDLPRVMGEGIAAAEQTCSALESWAAAYSERKGRTGGDSISDRAFAMTSALLALDDMNIRGYQILYALEYCDGSIETLYHHTSGNRSDDLCRYVSMKSARDYLAGDKTHCQIAVTHGASFQHSGSSWPDSVVLNMTERTAKRFAEDNVPVLDVDYSRLEIMGTVDMEQAMRIFEARGFQLVRRIDRAEKFESGRTVSSLVLYNPDTHDYIYAPTCLPENVCYGGVRLILYRENSVMSRRTLFWHCSSGPLRDQDGCYFEFTHHDGLFRCYDESMLFLSDSDFDWNKIGFSAYGVPVPTYFDLPFVRRDDLEKGLDRKTARVFDDMGCYCFTHLANRILCLYDEEMMKSCSPHYANYREWFFREGVFDGASIGFECSDSFVTVCNAVFTWLRVPDDIMCEFVANGEDYFARNRLVERRPGWYKKVLPRFNNDSEAGRAFMKVCGLPDPATLPVKLPWLKG